MHGRVAIVTGGVGGIGASISRAFSREGVGVAVADMDDWDENSVAPGGAPSARNGCV